MHNCRKCHSEDIHRSRVRTKWESWRKEITGKRPYRCRRCAWRGWGIDVGPKLAESDLALDGGAAAPEPPNLKGTAFARDGWPRELDLEALDATAPADETSARLP